MDYRTQVREALKRADNVRVAKGPPQEGGVMVAQPGAEGHPGQDGPNGPANRQIPKDHKYDPKSLKPMAKMLWAMSVSLGHALQAYRLFNRVKSSTVSPDGMLGGRGYIMKVTELRQKLYDAVEALSAVSDTVHDELNAPHWKPKIGELSSEDFESIEKLIGESENMLDNSEEEVDEEEAEAEKSGKPSASWVKKMKGDDKDDKGPASDLPSGGDSKTVPGKKPKNEQGGGARHKLAMTAPGPYDRRSPLERVAATIVENVLANSSVNPNSLGGPRVQHLDRADTDQTGPFGSVNVDEPKNPKDDWSTDEGVSGEPMSQDRGHQPSYQIDGGREAAPKMPVGESAMPTDHTPTEGFDFGIGRGNGNDAHGQGAKAPGGGTSYNDQGDKGVYGPRAELPYDPGGKTHDEENGDPTKITENSVGGLTARVHLRALKAIFTGPENPGPRSGLPIEDGPDVARSDYYDGPKDNDINTTKGPTVNPVMAQVPAEVAESELPNSSPPSKPAPQFHRGLHDNEFLFAQTALPGDGTAVNETFDKDLMDTGYRYERVDEPYTKWDDNTPNMRPDWNSQRDDQGPYAKPGN